jgi:hypothetical protein
MAYAPDQRPEQLGPGLIIQQFANDLVRIMIVY